MIRILLNAKELRAHYYRQYEMIRGPLIFKCMLWLIHST